MSKRIIREIAPLSDDDFFIVLNHQKAKFDFPIHFHPEYELNLVMKSAGKRIVGDSIKEYNSADLVLIGPNTPHAWTGYDGDAHVVTIQFHANVLDSNFLLRKITLPLKDLLEQAKMGVLFSKETTEFISDRILKLAEIRGFDSLLEFLSIMYDLAISRNQTLLSSLSYVGQFETSKSRRIKKVHEYLNAKLSEPIKISEVANLINMSPSAFSHFFKKRTQRSFTDYLTELRIGHAARLLIESEKNISEICYDSGFSNVSNFNRAFKGQKNCTPSEFRSQQKMITIH